VHAIVSGELVWSVQNLGTDRVERSCSIFVCYAVVRQPIAHSGLNIKKIDNDPRRCTKNLHEPQPRRICTSGLRGVCWTSSCLYGCPSDTFWSFALVPLGVAVWDHFSEAEFKSCAECAPSLLGMALLQWIPCNRWHSGPCWCFQPFCWAGYPFPPRHLHLCPMQFTLCSASQWVS
jgi:hypothetical protein